MHMYGIHAVMIDTSVRTWCDGSVSNTVELTATFAQQLLKLYSIIEYVMYVLKQG